VRKPYRETELLETIGELLGVRYSTDGSQAVTDAVGAAGDETPTVFPGAMDGLPAVLVDQLRSAALQGRARRLEQLADEAGSYSQAAATAIRLFALDFRYDALVSALEAQTPARAHDSQAWKQMMSDQSTNPGSVLVVDDTLGNLRLLGSLLGEEGYDVRPVSSGRQALQAVEHDSA
jgi:PleD family two-component response regulator